MPPHGPDGSREIYSINMRTAPLAAREVAADVLAEPAARSDMARKVRDSYVAFRDRTAPWSRAVLEVRER